MEIASELRPICQLVQQAGPERADNRFQRSVVPLYPHGEPVDLAARRVAFAQQIERCPALRIVADEATTEVGIVAARVVDCPAQRCQHSAPVVRC